MPCSVSLKSTPTSSSFIQTLVIITCAPTACIGKVYRAAGKINDPDRVTDIQREALTIQAYEIGAQQGCAGRAKYLVRGGKRSQA